jgi:hypothetical protein
VSVHEPAVFPVQFVTQSEYSGQKTSVSSLFSCCFSCCFLSLIFQAKRQAHKVAVNSITTIITQKSILMRSSRRYDSFIPSTYTIYIEITLVSSSHQRP